MLLFDITPWAACSAGNFIQTLYLTWQFSLKGFPAFRFPNRCVQLFVKPTFTNVGAVKPRAEPLIVTIYISPLFNGPDLGGLHSEPVPPLPLPFPPLPFPPLPPFFFVFRCLRSGLPFPPFLPLLRPCFPPTTVLLLASSPADSNHSAASAPAIYIIKKTKTAVKFRFLNLSNMEK